MQRLMHDMLHTIDEDRMCGAGDVEQAFDAQHTLAMGMQQHGQPDAERHPIHRALEDDAEAVHGRFMHGLGDEACRRRLVQARASVGTSGSASSAATSRPGAMA